MPIGELELALNAVKAQCDNLYNACYATLEYLGAGQDIPDDVNVVLDWNATLAKFEEIHSKLRALKGSLNLILDHVVPVPSAADDYVQELLNTFRVPTFAESEKKVLEQSEVDKLSYKTVSTRVALHNEVIGDATATYLDACDDLYRLTQRTKDRYAKKRNAAYLRGRSKMARLFRHMKDGNLRHVASFPAHQQLGQMKE